MLDLAAHGTQHSFCPKWSVTFQQAASVILLLFESGLNEWDTVLGITIKLCQKARYQSPGKNFKLHAFSNTCLLVVS